MWHSAFLWAMGKIIIFAFLTSNKKIMDDCHGLVQGWGLLSQFPPFRYFPIFSALSNHTLTIEYHVYIWQVSPQLSCGDTCQIWMWFEESNMCFCQVENFAYGEINERSFSNPHPRIGTSLSNWGGLPGSAPLSGHLYYLLFCQEEWFDYHQLPPHMNCLLNTSKYSIVRTLCGCNVLHRF